MEINEKTQEFHQISPKFCQPHKLLVSQRENFHFHKPPRHKLDTFSINRRFKSAQNPHETRGKSKMATAAAL